MSDQVRHDPLRDIMAHLKHRMVLWQLTPVILKVTTPERAASWEPDRLDRATAVFPPVVVRQDAATDHVDIVPEARLPLVPSTPAAVASKETAVDLLKDILGIVTGRENLGPEPGE
jgi:hypothetical protein